MPDTEGRGPGGMRPQRKEQPPRHPPGWASERTAQAEEPREEAGGSWGSPAGFSLRAGMSEEAWAPSYVGVHWNHKAERPIPVWVLGILGLVLLW